MVRWIRSEKTGFPEESPRKRRVYPLICWSISSTLQFGMLVGLGYEMVNSSVKRLKDLFREQLLHAFEGGLLFEPPIVEACLKTFYVEVRPAYFEKGKSFPSPHLVYIPVSAVFGKTMYESFECILPLLKRRFDYHSPAQLENLVQHYARDFFSKLAPEEIYRYSFPQEPRLEEIFLQTTEESAPTLKKRLSGKLFIEKIAEKYPQAKGGNQRFRGISSSG